ncbi:MAG TPA: hypothetical protein GX510_08770 [Firmicutes bacterium]|nr:hypothetical protein [Candidatus Fermentithermobacillaceae bacterium]
MEDSVSEYLQMIQLVIQRMANNSFLAKGWSVSLVAFLTALRGHGLGGVVVSFLPALAFWGLDAYYLRQERLFRALYNDVVRKMAAKQPFTCFNMDTSPYHREVGSLFQTLFCPSVVAVHGCVLSAVIFSCFM